MIENIFIPTPQPTRLCDIGYGKVKSGVSVYGKTRVTYQVPVKTTYHNGEIMTNEGSVSCMTDIIVPENSDLHRLKTRVFVASGYVKNPNTGNYEKNTWNICEPGGIQRAIIMAGRGPDTSSIEEELSYMCITNGMRVE